MPPPLRKLSQGKVDKTTTVVERPLVKKSSEKTFKLATVDKLATSITAEEEPNTNQKSAPTTSSSSASSNVQIIANNSGASGTSSQQQIHHELEPEEEVAFELPPPMKPIQDAQTIINNGPTVSSSSAVEQSPCKRVSYFFMTII